MSKVKLLALGPGSLLLGACASYQLFATDNLVAPTIACDDQGLPCCHYYRQMIHTIPNPVKLFLKHNRQHHVQVANTWNTDSVLWKITYRHPRDAPGNCVARPSGKTICEAPACHSARFARQVQRLSGATPALRRATQNKNQKDCLPAGFRGKMHEFTA
jgi:hypothetical protein